MTEHSAAAPRGGPLGALFTRSASDRILLGVAGGLGARLGIRAALLRVGFLLLLTAGPLAPVAYGLAWALSAAPPEDPARDPARADRPALSGRQRVGLLLIAVGGLLLFRSVGLWIGDSLVWPLAVAIAGSALIWTRAGAEAEARVARVGSLVDGVGGAGRIIAGGALVLGGLVALVAANQAILAAAGGTIGATVVTVLGLALVGGPWLVRLAREAAEDRRQRIRSEERAEMAAHLHDSVLHTLALIQRTEDSAEAGRLARTQERELRGWLYDGRVTGDARTITDLVEEMAGRIERYHDVKVETVVVGETAPDERVRALLDAAGEAVTNAARHAGVDVVSVYVEAEPERVTAFVRDEGRGFDPDDVPSDRHGIAESIRGRMRRNGGSAMIWSEPGEGTEVELELPLASDPVRGR